MRKWRQQEEQLKNFCSEGGVRKSWGQGRVSSKKVNSRAGLLAVEFEPVEKGRNWLCKRLFKITSLTKQEKMESRALSEEFVFLGSRDTSLIGRKVQEYE